MSQPLILIMAGGTGGHIMPGLAVADVMKSRGWTVAWLGNPEKMEGQLVPARGYPLAKVGFTGVRGKGLLTKLKAPFQLLGAMIQVWRHFDRMKPRVVLGMGGYVALPGGLVAWLKNVPLVVHEQNAVAGMTNTVLSRFAKCLLAGFPISIPEARVVGNPVRADLLKLASPEQRYGQRSGPLNVLVLGGSLGATALNTIVPQAIGLIAQQNRPVVTHQSGAQHITAMRQHYEEAGVKAVCLPFIDDMASALSAADLVICRAGAMTVAEVAAAGVAALFVPFPHAVDDHQTANAASLTEHGGAWLKQQNELTAAWLSQWLLASTRAELADVAVKAQACAQPDSANRIADICEQVSKVSK